MKKLFFILFAGFLSSAFAGSYVADPDRAKTIQWKTYPKAGHDFWMLLSPSWYLRKGVAEERFVQESGVAWRVTVRSNPHARRVISISEMDFYGKNGQRIKPRIKVSSIEKDALIVDPENLTDGKKQTYCVITGNVADVKRRYRRISATFTIRANKPIRNFTVTHGVGKNARIDRIRFNGKEIKAENKNGLLHCRLKNAASSFDFTVESTLEILSAVPYPASLAKRLKKYPFFLTPPVRFSTSNLLGLRPENIDKKSFERIEKEFADTFIGFRISEWDSNILAMLKHTSCRLGRELREYIDIPCDREGMLKNFKTFWDYHKSLFGNNIYGLSGMMNFEHHAMGFGSTVAALEITSEHKDHQHRNNYIFLRGSGRQFDKPMLMYFAYYMRDYTSFSSGHGKIGLDFGAPPSLSLRNFYISYYMGVNYLDFECQPWGQIKKNPDNTHTLTANGRALKDIFEWSRSAKGKRGSSYAPILLLADRKHGYDAWNRYSPHYQGAYSNFFPIGDGDLLLEYIMQATNPHGGYGDYKDASFIGNLRNSTLGDIFDLYVANPYGAAEVKLSQIEKYPVAFLATDLTYTRSLANTFKQYAWNGGTLILTSGQIAPYANDPGFLGATPNKTFTNADGLRIQHFTLNKNTKVLMRASNGTPLILKNKFGKGNVILITSPFMKKTKDRFKVPSQMVSMLEKIQSELLPVKIEGDCQFLFNVMPDGTWKVILINNRGIIKAPWESYEKHDQSYTREVKIIAPAGTKAIELRNNAKLKTETKNGKKVYTLKIPPAQIMVVDITGIKKAKVQKISRNKVAPVKGFVEKPYKPKLPYDGYRFVPPKKMFEKAPEVIGHWIAKDGYKNTVGKHHMTLKNIAPKNGRMIFDGKSRTWAQANFSAKYLLPEGTWMIWAKPVPKKDFPKSADTGKRHGGVIFTGNLILEYVNGNWVVRTVEMPRHTVFTGPEARPEWTHLAITWKNGFVRFYVNGKEVKKNTGPNKLINDIGINTFAGRISIVLGMLSPTWSTTPFAGELGDFIFLSRALSPEEIAKRSVKR